MYKWGNKELAKTQFTSEVKDWIREKMIESELRPVIERVGQLYPRFLSQEATDFFFQRIALLQAVARGEISSPEELSRYKTRREISAFLYKKKP